MHTMCKIYIFSNAYIRQRWFHHLKSVRPELEWSAVVVAGVVVADAVAGAAVVAATVAIVDVDPLFEELSLNNDDISFKYYF